MWRSSALIGLAFGLTVGGCDPVRTTSQIVRLQVVDSVSGQPVVGATVSLAFDQASARPLSKETELTAEEWKRYIKDHQQPGFRGVTNNRGQVDIHTKVTSLDRTSGATPPPYKDFVTGYPYLINVKAGELPAEEASLVMKIGDSFKEKSFTVTVLDIQGPRYVERDGARGSSPPQYGRTRRRAGSGGDSESSGSGGGGEASH
jgi:hypothetical protein